MAGKVDWRDNVSVERLWQPVKFEQVYLRAYDNLSAARNHLADQLLFYNSQKYRIHGEIDARSSNYQPSAINPVGSITTTSTNAATSC